MDVPAETRHMFHSPSGCKLRESYVPVVPDHPLNPDDIVRFTSGGVTRGHALDNDTLLPCLLSNSLAGIAMSILDKHAEASREPESIKQY